MVFFLTALGCTAFFSQQPTYVDGAYKATYRVECSKAKKVPTYHAEEKDDGNVRYSSFNLEYVNDSLVITSKAIVERPWIAPVSIFMSIAKQKHEDKTLEKFKSLYEEATK